MLYAIYLVQELRLCAFYNWALRQKVLNAAAAAAAVVVVVVVGVVCVVAVVVVVDVVGLELVSRQKNSTYYYY